jgi:putative endonuclease
MAVFIGGTFGLLSSRGTRDLLFLFNLRSGSNISDTPVRPRFHVYLLSSRSRNLYTGFTGDLVRRVWQHKTRQIVGFTSRYNITRLVYSEEYDTAADAIAREQQIKAWTRAKRVELIEGINPTWDDLSKGWYEPKVQKQIPRASGGCLIGTACI